MLVRAVSHQSAAPVYPPESERERWYLQLRDVEQRTGAEYVENNARRYTTVPGCRWSEIIDIRDISLGVIWLFVGRRYTEVYPTREHLLRYTQAGIVAALIRAFRGAGKWFETRNLRISVRNTCYVVRTRVSPRLWKKKVNFKRKQKENYYKFQLLRRIVYFEYTGIREKSEVIINGKSPRPRGTINLAASISIIP